MDARLVANLREAGCEVSFIEEFAPGISDEAVLELAVSRGAPLLTFDKDFGALAFRDNQPGIAVILLRDEPVKSKDLGLYGRLIMECLGRNDAAFYTIRRKRIRRRAFRSDNR